MLKQNTPEFKALTSISMNVLVCFLTGLPIKVMARSRLLLTSFFQSKDLETSSSYGNYPFTKTRDQNRKCFV